MDNLKYITRVPDKNYKPLVYKNIQQLNKYLNDKILLNDKNTTLSNEEIEALSLGLKYIPTDPVIHSKRVADSRNSFERYARKIDTMIYFKKAELNYPKPNKPPTKGHLTGVTKSHWDPPLAEWTNDETCRDLAQEITENIPTLDHNKSITHQNITEAINKLAKNESIHILPADKGGTIVIWDSQEYDREALRQLTDSKNYREIDREMYQLRTEGLRKKCTHFGKLLFDRQDPYITESEMTALQNVEASGSNIYFLPKIHKNKRPDTDTFAGRPIVATHSATVHLIDKFLTNLTSPLLKLIPGSLLDTTDLLNKLPSETLPLNSRIITSDVTGLYPSIPISIGVEATTQFYKDHLLELTNIFKSQNKKTPIPSNYFRILLEWVLSNSFINFKNRRYFHQTKGTAMGMCISVFFANCYMYKLTQIPITCPPKWLLLFQRFIDDIILIVTDDCSPVTLKDFFKSISNNSIQYETIEPSTRTSMLDLIVGIDPITNTIYTEPYKKATAADAFIHYTSNHPKATLNSIPYAQLLRLRRNSSNVINFLIHAKKLNKSFKKRGYPQYILENALTKAINIDRSQLLSRKTYIPKEQSHNKLLNAKYITKYHKLIDHRAEIGTLQELNNQISDIENPSLNDLSSFRVFSNDRTIQSFFTKIYKNPE